MKTFTINPHDWFNKRNTPRGFIDACSHSGQCDDDVKSFMNRFDVPDKEYLAKFLSCYGVWDESELENYEDNKMRLLWIMACDISEQKEFYYG